MTAGCCSAGARDVAATVNVPVPVPCVQRAPDRPALASDADLDAMSDYQLVFALWRDRLQRIGYEAELEALVTACASVR